MIQKRDGYVIVYVVDINPKISGSDPNKWLADSVDKDKDKALLLGRNLVDFESGLLREGGEHWFILAKFR